MAKTPAQRGRIGNWLRESRLARGYSTTAEARREIERLTGWRIAPSVYAEWESGRRTPSEDNLERLVGFYGGAPDAPRATNEVAEVVEVLKRQAQALEAIEEMLRGRTEWERKLLTGMRLDRGLQEQLHVVLTGLVAAALGVPVDLPGLPDGGELDAPEDALPRHRGLEGDGA